ncbi:3479_t:CDS:2, partial [Entrophospora sp. SA101]
MFEIFNDSFVKESQNSVIMPYSHDINGGNVNNHDHNNTTNPKFLKSKFDQNVDFINEKSPIYNTNNDDSREFNEKIYPVNNSNLTVDTSIKSIRKLNTKRSTGSLFKLSLKRNNSNIWNSSTMPDLNNITIITQPPSPIANSAQLWKQDLDPNVKAQMKAAEIHRQVIIHEIIRTEDEYVKDLRYFLENHVPKIRESGVKLPASLEKIFTILPYIFLLHLNTSVSNVLGDMSKELEVYESYLIHHQMAIAELTNARKKNNKLGQILNYLDKKELPTGKYMSVESLLAKPFQRLCKYPLLIMTLLKATEKSHEDFTSLNDLYEQMDCAIKDLQERKSEYEQSKECEEFTKKFYTFR